MFRKSVPLLVSPVKRCMRLRKMRENAYVEYEETENGVETAEPDSPANHFVREEAAIGSTVREAVSEKFSGIETEMIEFPCMVSFDHDENGRPYLEDNRSMVRYYPVSGSVEVTEEHTEREVVASNNQRALELNEMCGMR